MDYTLMNQMSVKDISYQPAPFILDPESARPRSKSEYSSGLDVMETLRKTSYQKAPLNKSLTQIKPQDPKSQYSSSLDVGMLLKKPSVLASKENPIEKKEEGAKEKDNEKEDESKEEPIEKKEEDESKEKEEKESESENSEDDGSKEE